MGNMPSIYKTKVSLQLDNEVIVALDTKAEADGTSRNSVANYLLESSLSSIIKAFSQKQKNTISQMEKKNKEARHAK